MINQLITQSIKKSMHQEINVSNDSTSILSMNRPKYVHDASLNMSKFQHLWL